MKKILLILFCLFMISGCKSTSYNDEELSAPLFLKEELKKIEK